MWNKCRILVKWDIQGRTVEVAIKQSVEKSEGTSYLRSKKATSRTMIQFNIFSSSI